MFNNFLNNVKTVATNVAQSVEDQNRAGTQHHITEEVEDTIDMIDAQAKKDAAKDAKGGDFLSGLVGVAQVVGKSLEEHNKQVEELKNKEETVGKVDSRGGKVQVSTIQDDERKNGGEKPDFFTGLVATAQDIGKVVGKSLEEHNKQLEDLKNSEDEVRKIDSQQGKVQVSTVQDDSKKGEFKGAELMSGLVGVAQLVGKSLEEHNKKVEELKNAEETVGKVDSQGGKVQVSTIQDNETKKDDAKSGDFFASLVGVAQVVGQSLDERNKQEHLKNTEETVGKVDSQGGKVQLTTIQNETQSKSEDTKPDFFSGLVATAQDIGKVVGKSLEERNKPVEQLVEEPVGRVDSQGGKVQVTTVQDSINKEQNSDKSSNFLSGLMNIAQDIGKSVEKSRNEQDPSKTAPEAQNASSSSSKLDENDLKALGENIGSIVGGMFKKPAVDPKKDAEVDFKSQAVIDDIEGEIGKVTTSGYTNAPSP